MTTWDRQSPRAQAALQRTLLRAQLRSAVAPFSPYWRKRSRVAGRDLGSVDNADDLASVPAVGERDVCADGDPAAAAELVLQGDEEGYVLAGDGPAVRRAVVRRVLAPRSYRTLVEADTRPVSYVMAGLGLRYPVASTRADLDVVARTGARLWSVLGLGSHDVLVSGVPVAATTEHRGLELAALAAGSPALFPGPAGLDETLGLVPATVLALPSATAAAQLSDLDPRRLASVTTLLLIGAPTAAERAAATAALDRDEAAVLGVHAPAGARLLWGECRESAGRVADAGYHSYPDYDLLQTVDAETGEAGGGIDAVELVLTQLQLKGSALVRWRTGDVVADEPHVGQCPACERTVPRLVDLRRAELVPTIAPRRAEPMAVDLREVAGAITGRSGIADWSVVLGASDRDGADELLVHLAVDGAPEAETAVAVARDISAAAGVLPTQVVLGPAGALPAGEVAITRRMSRRR